MPTDTLTTTLPIAVEHNGVATTFDEDYHTDTDYAPYTAYQNRHDTPEHDPFYYGTRTLIEYDANGKELYREIPLTLDDFLDPMEGDFFMQGGLHEEDVQKLKSTFRYRYRHDPSILVSSDKKMCWHILGLKEPAPDVAIIPNVHNEQDPYQSSFDVQQEGTSPRFVLEVVSPRYRIKDTDDKVDIYLRAGVREYHILNSRFNKKTGVVEYEFIGYRVKGTKYVRIIPNEQGYIYSATEDVWLGVSEQRDRFFVLDGQTMEEILPDDERAAKAEERVLEEQEQRKQAEERALEEQEQRKQAEERARIHEEQYLEQQRASARAMLTDGIAPAIIAKYTGLSLDTIEALGT